MSSVDALLLGELRRDRERLAALPIAGLGAGVAACPGWDVAALLVHLSRVHRWATARVAADVGAEVRFPARPEAGVDVLRWTLEGLAALIDVLSSLDLEEQCGSFAGTVPRWWWLRRQAIETALHRWDAQQAVGLDPHPTSPEVATVGIAEWCELQAMRWPTLTSDLTGTVHLHATDGEGEWLIEVRPDAFTWTEGHHKGDVAVRGTRSDLLLLLWSRLGSDSLEVFGDSALLRRLTDATAM